MREKGLLNPLKAIIDSSFINNFLEYPNNGKLKPPVIDPYNGTKDSIDHFYVHLDILNAIIC